LTMSSCERSIQASSELQPLSRLFHCGRISSYLSVYLSGRDNYQYCPPSIAVAGLATDENRSGASRRPDLQPDPSGTGPGPG
jgi:hypothetical protein